MISKGRRTAKDDRNQDEESNGILKMDKLIPPSGKGGGMSDGEKG
jgi:hypothetical protein